MRLKELVSFGIGNTIGVGIFVLTGIAAKYAGPATFLCYIINTIVFLPTALVYSELAALIPLKGSAYCYVYCSYGELMAFMVGWQLI